MYQLQTDITIHKSKENTKSLEAIGGKVSNCYKQYRANTQGKQENNQFSISVFCTEYVFYFRQPQDLAHPLQ